MKCIVPNEGDIWYSWHWQGLARLTDQLWLLQHSHQRRKASQNWSRLTQTLTLLGLWVDLKMFTWLWRLDPILVCTTWYYDVPFMHACFSIQEDHYARQMKEIECTGCKAKNWENWPTKLNWIRQDSWSDKQEYSCAGAVLWTMYCLAVVLPLLAAGLDQATQYGAADNMMDQSFFWQGCVCQHTSNRSTL